jgi:hypothetical protein
MKGVPPLNHGPKTLTAIKNTLSDPQSRSQLRMSVGRAKIVPRADVR